MSTTTRLFLLTFAFALATLGQSFSSGSTGVDGALDLTNGDRTVQLPDSGILNYTTVNIPPGRILTFGLNLRNTPVIVLAQGAVVVSGTINLSASGQTPGPGGFYGGDWAYPSRSSSGGPGLGPGGGAPGKDTAYIQDAKGQPGQWVGPLSLVPSIGGSGGGGSTSGWVFAVCGGPGYGGGGGGAITIASSTSIAVAGAIVASGDRPYCSANGADGAIRLVSNSINVTGSLSSVSVVRLEAPLNALVYTGSGTPPVRSTINPLIVPANLPSIVFSAIAGYQVPSYSGSSQTTIDLMLPTQLQDPLPVVVHATNVPVGTPVSLSFSAASAGTAISTTATLSGTTASSSATLYVSGLNRSAITYLFVMATFDPAFIANNLKQSGPNAVARVELASAVGESTTYRFLRRDGTELDPSNVPAELRRALGR